MPTRAAALAVAAAVAVALASAAATAPPQWQRDLALISKGLARAADKGWLDPESVSEYRAAAAKAEAVLPRLPRSRYRNLVAVVHQVAGFWKGYDAPRGRTLFAMLDFNRRWFANHWDRPAGTDVVDYSDGTWYRAFPGIGFQFHPLENFGKLNNFVAQKNVPRSEQLAEALIDRSVVRAGGLGWEYYFRFGGGRPPWLSGMAQAVAAQALSRTATLLADPALTAASQRVYRTVPALTRRIGGRPWVRLYSFSDVAVLNAQLQAIVSLQDYATQTGDQQAAALTAQLQGAATALLPRFDTGAWSLYSLGGAEAPLEYHTYVVRLLMLLARRTQDPTLTQYAQRFSADLRQPPAVRPGAPPAAIYPWPADGYRDGARYVFWISKRSTVRLQVEDGGAASVVSRGWHSIVWSPGKRAPGIYTAYVHAVDLAGNASETELPAVEVRRDTRAPDVSAALAG